MARITWLADVLRAADLEVVEHENWTTHRRPRPWDPQFLVAHATANFRSTSDKEQIKSVRNGRSDLRGPIANACIDRKGRWHVLSAGHCNTVKVGWAGPFEGEGNTHALGIEACNDNGREEPPEPWPDVQYNSYVRGVAAICRRMGWDASRIIGHKQHQPGDKSDPLFNMDTFRANVTAALAGRFKEDDVSETDVYAALENKRGQAALEKAVVSVLADGFAAAKGQAPADNAEDRRKRNIRDFLRGILDQSPVLTALRDDAARDAQTAAAIAGLQNAVGALGQASGALSDEQFAKLLAAIHDAGEKAGIAAATEVSVRVDSLRDQLENDD